MSLMFPPPPCQCCFLFTFSTYVIDGLIWSAGPVRRCTVGMTALSIRVSPMTALFRCCVFVSVSNSSCACVCMLVSVCRGGVVKQGEEGTGSFSVALAHEQDWDTSTS